MRPILSSHALEEIGVLGRNGEEKGKLGRSREIRNSSQALVSLCRIALIESWQTEDLMKTVSVASSRGHTYAGWFRGN